MCACACTLSVAEAAGNRAFFVEIGLNDGKLKKYLSDIFPFAVLCAGARDRHAERGGSGHTFAFRTLPVFSPGNLRRRAHLCDDIPGDEQGGMDKLQTVFWYDHVKRILAGRGQFTHIQRTRGKTVRAKARRNNLVRFPFAIIAGPLGIIGFGVAMAPETSEL
jgi:hypothetical protein